MNEALLQAADSRTNEEDKNREVYMPPRLNKLEYKLTENGGNLGGQDGPYAS